MHMHPSAACRDRYSCVNTVRSGLRDAGVSVTTAARNSALRAQHRTADCGRLPLTAAVRDAPACIRKFQGHAWDRRTWLRVPAGVYDHIYAECGPRVDEQLQQHDLSIAPLPLPTTNSMDPPHIGLASIRAASFQGAACRLCKCDVEWQKWLPGARGSSP